VPCSAGLLLVAALFGKKDRKKLHFFVQLPDKLFRLTLTVKEQQGNTA